MIHGNVYYNRLLCCSCKNWTVSICVKIIQLSAIITEIFSLHLVTQEDSTYNLDLTELTQPKNMLNFLTM